MNGNTLLNLAVSFAARPDWKGGVSGGVSVIEALLAAGSDVNDANDRGWTSLHAAAYATNPRLQKLLAKGAALDAEAHGAGGTPLIAALFWGHREFADVGAPPSGTGESSRSCGAWHSRASGRLLERRALSDP